MLLLHAFFALLYFYNVSSYSAIQPQVCNKLSVQCSVFINLTKISWRSGASASRVFSVWFLCVRLSVDVRGALVKYRADRTDISNAQSELSGLSTMSSTYCSSDKSPRSVIDFLSVARTNCDWNFSLGATVGQRTWYQKSFFVSPWTHSWNKTDTKLKQQESRPVAGRTARCRCKFRYDVSKFTVASRGFHCDCSAFVLKNRKNQSKITVLHMYTVFIAFKSSNSLFNSHCLRYKHQRPFKMLKL